MCNIYFWPACKVVKLKEWNVTLLTSLFMFHLISFSLHFIVHVSSHFLESTLHWSCFIFISFSPQSISFISPTTVHLVHVYLIWLYSYYMAIQPHCQFHFSNTVDIEPAALLEMSPTAGISQVHINRLTFFQGKPLNGLF